MADKKVMLTQDGYDKLVDKLNYLKSVRRIEVAERLKAAIALGDLSENSEYVDAKNEQGFLEGEIMDLQRYHSRRGDRRCFARQHSQNPFPERRRRYLHDCWLDRG